MLLKINGSAFALARTVLNDKGNLDMLRLVTKIFSAMMLFAVLSFAEDPSIYELNGQKVRSIDASRKPKAVVTDLRQEASESRQDLSNAAQDTFRVSLKDSVFWIEVEKNKDYTICVDDPNAGIWKSKSFSFQKETGNCIRLNSGNYVKSGEIRYATKMGNVYAFNVLVEMKYIDLREGVHLLGFTNMNEYRLKKEVVYWDIESELNNRIYLDRTRVEKMDVTLVVDKYMVTGCEFVQTLWDSIPSNLVGKDLNDGHNSWIERKWRLSKEGVCDAHDSAEIRAMPYWALIYANLRSRRDGLKPVYSFREGEVQTTRWNKSGGFELRRPGFQGVTFVHVDVNDSADGYRLPYYNEWMALARGGEPNVEYVWGNEDDSLQAIQYAWFGVREADDPHMEFWGKSDMESISWLNFSCGRFWQKSRPVGMLKPNAFGLYDVSGLVCENVMLPGKSIFKDEIFSCKGGSLPDTLKGLNLGKHCDTKSNHRLSFQGLRLVRQIR